MNIRSSKYYAFFGALSTPLRIQIISSLAESPKTVTQLCKDIGVEQSKLSHALKSLNICSIVGVKKRGKNRVYSLNKETMIPILKLIEKHEKKFCKHCKKFMEKK